MSEYKINAAKAIIETMKKGYGFRAYSRDGGAELSDESMLGLLFMAIPEPPADAHTARLAALDAEIAEVERQITDARRDGCGDAVRYTAAVLKGLRRAREIITGAKP